MYYSLSSDRVADLWSAVRDIAAEHVAGIDRLASDYVGDRQDIDPITRKELATRLRRRDVVVIDVRPRPEYEAGHTPGARSMPLRLEDGFPEWRRAGWAVATGTDGI